MAVLQSSGQHMTRQEVTVGTLELLLGQHRQCHGNEQNLSMACSAQTHLFRPQTTPLGFQRLQEGLLHVLKHQILQMHTT